MARRTALGFAFALLGATPAVAVEATTADQQLKAI
jgi:hypothetical protein